MSQLAAVAGLVLVGFAHPAHLSAWGSICECLHRDILFARVTEQIQALGNSLSLPQFGDCSFDGINLIGEFLPTCGRYVDLRGVLILPAAVFN